MDDLKNIAPNLASIKKENSFNAPDGYFNEFPLKIQNRINKNKKESGLEWFWIFTKKPIFAVSFSLVVAILIALPVIFLLNQKQNTNKQLAYQNIEMSELEYFDISEMNLVEALSTEELEDMSILDNNKDDVDMYILENVDYSTLLDEL